MPAPYFLTGFYVSTIIFGILGNVWVVCSVARSRKPRSVMGHTSPSDRLRAYISVLAIVDLTVLMALLVRCIYLALPHFMLDSNSCRVIFVMENSLKMCSLIVLSCISIERLITIKKPFCSQIRKQVVKYTPILALFAVSLALASILIQITSVSVTSDGMNCLRAFRNRTSPKFGAYLAACAFALNLTTICLNYGQIVHHVRMKFVKRRARAVASQRQKESLVTEPRYMRQMTSAIIRVGLFHAVCWLPFCVVQFLPDQNIVSDLTASIRLFNNFTDYTPIRWVVFTANWLTYANAAGDWIFYAAMNRDLRNLIRFATERRKRSTMSHAPSPSHRSLRKQVTSSMRVLNSISYRSSLAGSVDDTQLPSGNVQASPKSSTVSHDNHSPHTTRHKTALLAACQSSEMV